MTQRFISVTGFVLAGGASRRTGRDKATLILGDESLLSRQVRVLRAGFAPRLFANLNTPNDYESAKRSVGAAVELVRS